MTTTQYETKQSHTKYTIREARANFADISNRVAYAGERMVVNRYRKPVMAIVPIEDLLLLEKLEKDQDVKLARQRLKTMDKHGTITLSELEKDLLS
jgi:prevent-host-death family protein